MKTVSFSFVSKFPAKKVIDCFTNPDFAKLHKASKLFSKAGIIKADKKMIIRFLSDADKSAVPCVAVITFADAEDGKATAVSATFVNYSDDKAAGIKELGKIINDDIKTFLTPKVAAPAKAVKAVKAPAKKPVAKATKVAKAPAKKPVAKTAKKIAKPVAAKPVAVKAVVAENTSANAPVSKAVLPTKK